MPRAPTKCPLWPFLPRRVCAIGERTTRRHSSPVSAALVVSPGRTRRARRVPRRRCRSRLSRSRQHRDDGWSADGRTAAGPVPGLPGYAHMHIVGSGPHPVYVQAAADGMYPAFLYRHARRGRRTLCATGGSTAANEITVRALRSGSTDGLEFCGWRQEPVSGCDGSRSALHLARRR